MPMLASTLGARSGSGFSAAPPTRLRLCSLMRASMRASAALSSSNRCIPTPIQPEVDPLSLMGGGLATTGRASLDPTAAHMPAPRPVGAASLASAPTLPVRRLAANSCAGWAEAVPVVLVGVLMREA
jgi:hypothetical protein